MTVGETFSKTHFLGSYEICQDCLDFFSFSGNVLPCSKTFSYYSNVNMKSVGLPRQKELLT